MSEYIFDVPDSNKPIAGESALYYPDERDKPMAVGEEIVRCRDCKHFTPKGTRKFESGKTNADYCKYVRGLMLQITPDGYCKWGERKVMNA